MTETNLTTTITSLEYKTLLFELADANRLAGAVAADWLASASFGLNKPSDTTLEALRDFDRELYYETKQKVEEAESARKNAADPGETLPGYGNPIPAIIPDTSPGWPYKGIEITCETEGETT